jgi:hypothetical protein
MEWRSCTALLSAHFVGATGLDTRCAHFAAFTTLHHFWSHKISGARVAPESQIRFPPCFRYWMYKIEKHGVGDVFSSRVTFMPNFVKVCQPVRKFK